MADLNRRHHRASYDGVLNIVLRGYSTLARQRITRREGRVAVAFSRLAFAVDDEYERRQAAGSPATLDELLRADLVARPLDELRALASGFSSYEASRPLLLDFVGSLYLDYTSDGDERGPRPDALPDDIGGLVRKAEIDSGGFLHAVVLLVALVTGRVPLAERHAAQFVALGVLGKAADDLTDLRLDDAAGRANLLGALIDRVPGEREAVLGGWRSGARMSTAWWRRTCPRAFEQLSALCADHYAALDSAWLRFASDLLWVPALLGRATTDDQRGRL